MSDVTALQDAIQAFVRERDWEQFHTPKDLSIALSIEAAELLETFLWKGEGACDVDKVREELADVLIYALMLARKLSLDVPGIVRDKLLLNAQRYPVEKSRGTSQKHTAL